MAPDEREVLRESLIEEIGDSAYDAIKDMLEETIGDTANAHAAEAWSTPTDEIMEEFGGDVIVVAQFGDRLAVNGDIVGELPPVPEGYRITRYGGDIPSIEEEVSVDHAINAVARETKSPIRTVQRVAESEGYGELVYVGVGGDSEVYARVKDEPEDED